MINDKSLTAKCVSLGALCSFRSCCSLIVLSNLLVQWREWKTRSKQSWDDINCWCDDSFHWECLFLFAAEKYCSPLCWIHWDKLIFFLTCPPTPHPNCRSTCSVNEQSFFLFCFFLWCVFIMNQQHCHLQFPGSTQSQHAYFLFSPSLPLISKSLCSFLAKAPYAYVWLGSCLGLSMCLS